jgi:hypothetical protein
MAKCMSCSYKDVPTKERKTLFNEFCANAVEERKKVEVEAHDRASEQLRELFAELLAVMPLQFRLFREGRSLDEVEMEVEAEEALRAGLLAQDADGGGSWEGEENGEELPPVGESSVAQEGEAAVQPAGAGAETAGEEPVACPLEEDGQSFVDAVRAADLEMRRGGLFTADTTLQDVGQLVGGDERWKNCPEDIKVSAFDEVLAPVIAERAAEDKALRARFRPRMHAWLARSNVSLGATWEVMRSMRRGRLAQLPDWLAKALFEEYLDELSAKEVCPGCRHLC